VDEVKPQKDTLFERSSKNAITRASTPEEPLCMPEAEQDNA